MRAPTLNLNGTSAALLIDDAMKAYNALTLAARQLRLMRPHGRDYQTVPEEVYTAARAEHEAAIRHVDATIAELVAYIRAIQRQQRNPNPE